MIGLFVITLSVSAAQAQEGLPDRRSISPAQHYLNSKNDVLRKRDDAARRLAADARVQGILTILRQKGAFATADVIGQTEDEKNAVREALRRGAALDMVAYSLEPNILQGPRGDDFVKAIERVTAGTETLEDLVLLGERIVVAEIADELPSDVPSRIGRETSFTIREVLKGPAGPSTFVAGRDASTMYSGAKKGARFLFFLSPTVARFKQAENLPLSGRDTAFQFVPYALQGEALIRLDSTQTDPRGATLSKVGALARM